MTKTTTFKPSEKLLRDVRCGYLYANGRLVLVHETEHAKAGTVEWATIHETAIGCAFKGRIVLHRAGTVRLACAALRVQISEMSPENGSENTRKRGLSIGHVTLTLGPNTYRDIVYIPLLDGLSSDWSYQPEQGWTDLETPSRWAGYPVAV